MLPRWAATAELYGDEGVDSDLLNRSFEIPQKAKTDFPNIEPKLQAICAGYANGLNYYLAKHPEVKPRLITHFEPSDVLAYERHVLLEFMFGKSHAPRKDVRKSIEEIKAATGSNVWAIGPEPHAIQEGHAVRQSPPAVVRLWPVLRRPLEERRRLEFLGSHFLRRTDPDDRTQRAPGLVAHRQRSRRGRRVARNVRRSFQQIELQVWRRLSARPPSGRKRSRSCRPTGTKEKVFTLRKTHHGPILGRAEDGRWMAVQISRLAEGSRLRQALKMTKASNFAEWRAAMSELNLQMFNTCYADQEGNIFYVYNAAVPKRDPSFDWTKPVDGSDPRTDWKGVHAFDDLPQILNPKSAYLQNCNSTPFFTTDEGNPAIGDFPAYMVEDRNDDKRRAKVSRMLLRNMHDITFENWKESAWDTTLYWPLVQLPALAIELKALEASDPTLAAKCKPFMDHLLDWDCRSAIDSTQTTLCYLWYEEMYGRGYPVETLKPEFVDAPAKKFQALVTAAGKLKTFYGNWQVKWGDVSRMQRHVNYADMAKIPFSDALPSLPCAGAPGPLGVVFNTYYAPPTAQRKKQYGVVGGSFIGVYEFGDKVKAATMLQFGESSNPDSPHFMDQAQLYSKKQFKPAWFDWDDVLAHAKSSYHPGAEPR